MTPEEKLAQLVRGEAVTPAMLASGVGLLEAGGIVAGASRPSDVARAYNAAVSAFLSAGPGARLGIPPAYRSLATHGGEAFGTIFPQGPALGATWDTSLVAAAAAAQAAEARSVGISLTTFVIHMVADARFGRQEEGFSEEPTLTAAMAAACTAGSQGGAGAAADAYILPPAAPALFKHLGAYGAPAGGLNGARADAPAHAVLDSFLKPWRRAAAAGARGVMPAHCTVLGVPAHGSPWLLRDRLRGDYGMAGLFLADTGDVSALRGFRLCADNASCAALAVTAGVDVEQPPGAAFAALGDAVARGLASQATVDAAVGRVLAHKFSAGVFDAPLLPNASAADDIVNSPAHRALARAAAAEGAVLLKNDGGVLPLAPGAPDAPLRLALIGPNADDVPALLGNYDGLGPLPLTGVATVRAALAAAGGVAVTYARGANVDDGNTSLIPAAAAAAADADAVVLVLGDSAASCGEGRDRDDLDLPGGQLPLLAAVAAAARAPVTVVLVNGRAATFGAAAGNALLANVSALLVAWRPGQEGGLAIADVLLGRAEPGGRLPHSWLRAAGHAGGSASPWLQPRTARFDVAPSGAERRGYAQYWNDVNSPTPLFAFGEGRGYTDFLCGNLTVAPAGAAAAQGAAAPFFALVDVRNTGAARAGSTVVQVYAQDPVGSGAALIVRPWKRLVGFARVTLPPGAATRASIPLLADDLAYYGDDDRLAIHAGEYIVSAGLSSLDDDGPGQVASLTVQPAHAAALSAALAHRQRARGAAAAG